MTDGETPTSVLSAWEAALGDDRVRLHPRIRKYVRAVPPGYVGRGEGVYDVAGCLSAALAPALSIAGSMSIAFPEAGANVPFTIENRGDGAGVVHARRTFRFAERTRVMVDAVRPHGRLAIDALGTGGLLEAALRVSVVDGALQAVSRGVRVRVGSAWLRVPAAVRPRVWFRDRFDDSVGRQHIELRVAVGESRPVYGYRGWFDYKVVPDDLDGRIE